MYLSQSNLPEWGEQEMTVPRRVALLVVGIAAFTIAAIILPDTSDLGYTDCTDGPAVCLPPAVRAVLDGPAITIGGIGLVLIITALVLWIPSSQTEEADHK